MDKITGQVRRSRGISPVIATIILSAVVIAVGGAVWSYSQGATTIIANSYVNDTLDVLNEVIERFMVEHVSNKSDGSIMYVWIYNFGDVDIIVDLYANATGKYGSTLGTSIASGDLVKIDVSFEEEEHLQGGDHVALKAHSRRQNNVYYTYYVT